MHNIFYTIVVSALSVLLAIYSKDAPRTQGKNLTYHAYVIGVFVVSMLLPLEVKEVLFTPLNVLIVAEIYPIYESIRAVCTIEETDDSTWLMYWIAQGVVSFTTEWMNDVAGWNHFEFFFYIWLHLPFTDGATFIFDKITEPFLAPRIQPIVQKADNFIGKVVLASVNVTHLSIVWMIFVILPPTLKRIIWIMLATVYPMGSSIISVTTPDPADDTFWLTYWSCFGCLYLIADFLEDYIGNFPGFYSLVILATVYLMLPMFRGAESIFRHILVPLAGLQEMLMKKDADNVKKAILREVPEDRRAALMKEIGKSFTNHKFEKSGGTKGSYQSIV